MQFFLRRGPVLTGLAALLTACSASLPLQRMGSTHFSMRCTHEQVDERRCPGHPYQCLGDLPEGAELIGLIEATTNESLDVFRERAAMEGGDLLVLGPFHQEPMRLGAPPSYPAHIFQRVAVVRLPPMEGAQCQGSGGRGE